MGSEGCCALSRSASSFPFEVGETTETFTEEKTEALEEAVYCYGYNDAWPHSPVDGVTWCFWCSLGSQRGLDHRQEAASPELPSLLWSPPAGPAVGMLVFGLVRCAGCVGPSGLCPSQPEGV